MSQVEVAMEEWPRENGGAIVGIQNVGQKNRSLVALSPRPPPRRSFPRNHVPLTGHQHSASETAIRQVSCRFIQAEARTKVSRHLHILIVFIF